jgi:hypothetical protein
MFTLIFCAQSWAGLMPIENELALLRVCSTKSATLSCCCSNCFDRTISVQSELELLLRGQGEVWSPAFLLATIKCDHGYTNQSRSVRHFVDVLCELSQAEQRTLLRFVTGSPRLPPGGLTALRPPLTIVMKQRSSGAALCVCLRCPNCR